eukprot:3938156-Rhodomonas_salina.2
MVLWPESVFVVVRGVTGDAEVVRDGLGLFEVIVGYPDCPGVRRREGAVLSVDEAFCGLFYVVEGCDLDDVVVGCGEGVTQWGSGCCSLRDVHCWSALVCGFSAEGEEFGGCVCGGDRDMWEKGIHGVDLCESRVCCEEVGAVDVCSVVQGGEGCGEMPCRGRAGEG